MAQHLIVNTLATAGEGARTFPVGRYLGFAIGAESEHDIVAVETPQGTRRVCTRGLLLCEPFEGSPIISAVRLGAYPAKAHVIGLTCSSELGAVSRRQPYRDRQTLTIAGGVASLVIPFAGREHVEFYLVNNGAASMTATFKGRRYYASGSYDELTLTAAQTIAAAATLGQNEGGTNDREMWDAIEVALTGTNADACVVNVEAVD